MGTLKDWASRPLENCDVSIAFPLPGACPTSTYDTILSCLKIDENLRPTATQLHVTLAGVESPPADMHAGIVDTSGASVGTSASAWSGPCEAEGSDASAEASFADVFPDPVESSEATS